VLPRLRVATRHGVHVAMGLRPKPRGFALSGEKGRRGVELRDGDDVEAHGVNFTLMG
jgi:hypothetical protein